MIMKRLNRKLSSGEMAVMAVLLLCMVLAVTISAIRVASSQNSQEDQFVELNQTGDVSEQSAADTETDSRETTGETVINKGVPEKTKEIKTESSMDLIAKEDQEEVTLEDGIGPAEDPPVQSADQTAQEQPETVKASAAVQEAAHIPDFEAGDRLSWPVSGNVILDFSMDHTIYFPTLKQYKYNPAIVISSETGTAVEAAADGKVTSIQVNEETGTTVTVDMGNGYTAIYGQLKEVPVKEGSVVYRHEVLGYISEPAKYYTVEGSNLYFEVQKDGVPIDPLDCLE